MALARRERDRQEAPLLKIYSNLRIDFFAPVFVDGALRLNLSRLIHLQRAFKVCRSRVQTKVFYFEPSRHLVFMSKGRFNLHIF